MKHWQTLLWPYGTGDDFTPTMYRRVFLPALVSALGQAVADMADALLLGQRMGEVGLAAIGMTLPLFMLLNVFIYGFGIGGSVKFAQLLGEGKPDAALSNFHHVLRAALGVGAAIAVGVNLFPDAALHILGAGAADRALYLQTKIYVRLIAAGSPLFLLQYLLNYYLLCDDQASRASVGLAVGCAVDLGGNVLLVTVLDLGTLGAGLATLLGLAVGCAIYLLGVRGKTGTLRWQRGLGRDPREAWACFKTGAATSAQYVYQILFLLLANHSLMAIFGGTGVAVLDMLQNASYLILYLYEAAGKALQPLAGTFFGEKDRASLRRALDLALNSGVACGALAAVLIGVFARQMCAAFGLSSAAAVAAGMPALRIYCVSSLFAGVSIVLESYCQAVEQERSAFLLSALRGCVILLPATLLLAAFAPAAFWWLYPITEVLALLSFGLWVRRTGMPTVACDPARIFSRRICSDVQELGALTEDIERFCEENGASPRQSYFVVMAAEELCAAVIQRAFHGAGGAIRVTLIACEDGDFELHLRDNAARFDPFSLQTKKAARDEAFDVDAMGVLVIKKQAKSFFYRQYQGFNTLVVRI